MNGRNLWLLFGLGVFGTGCALDSGAVPTEEPAAATRSLAAIDCSEGEDCATAAHDDSFNVSTGDGCGRADFVDFGPGAPGGGDNDDYIVIHDFCSDKHGVKAWAWIDGSSVNHDVGGYNGNGLAGDPVIWDPFKQADGTDVKKDQSLRIKVCLVDGASDSTGLSCRELTLVSVDG